MRMQWGGEKRTMALHPAGQLTESQQLTMDLAHSRLHLHICTPEQHLQSLYSPLQLLAAHSQQDLLFGIRSTLALWQTATCQKLSAQDTLAANRNLAAFTIVTAAAGGEHARRAASAAAVTGTAHCAIAPSRPATPCPSRL